MSHSDTFDKPFPLNDPVEPGRRKRPAGTQEISQGRTPLEARPNQVMRPARDAGIAAEIHPLNKPGRRKVG